MDPQHCGKPPHTSNGRDINTWQHVASAAGVCRDSYIHSSWFYGSFGGWGVGGAQYGLLFCFLTHIAWFCWKHTVERVASSLSVFRSHLQIQLFSSFATCLATGAKTCLTQKFQIVVETYAGFGEKIFSSCEHVEKIALAIMYTLNSLCIWKATFYILYGKNFNNDFELLQFKRRETWCPNCQLTLSNLCKTSANLGSLPNR